MIKSKVYNPSTELTIMLRLDRLAIEGYRMNVVSEYRMLKKGFSKEELKKLR
jgi:hypothetical protein